VLVVATPVATLAFHAKETPAGTGVGAGVETGVGAGVETGVGTGVGAGVETGGGEGLEIGVGVGVGVGDGEPDARKATICIIHWPALVRGAVAL
jgi:hypothetical protein